MTVAEMIKALLVLPQDAKLVVTQEGYYSEDEFAEIMEPEKYITKTSDNNESLAKGSIVYRIGHSEQNH